MAPPKECPPGKILNPATNRCIDINGKKAKALAADPHQKTSPKKTSPQKTCPQGQVLACVDIKSAPKETATNKGLKEAQVWVRAPWRDYENNPLQARSDKWISIYRNAAPHLQKIFTIQNEQYALDAYSVRKNINDSMDLYAHEGMSFDHFYAIGEKSNSTETKKRLNLVQKNLAKFNKVELALLISNCIISYYTYGYDYAIESLCKTLVKRYYSKDVPDEPVIKTLGKKAITYNKDSSFFDQLTRKWKSKDLVKYPYNELLPAPAI
jgi:hypothetical protein